MFCPKCGAQIADGGRFCPSCGATVAQETPAPSAPPVWDGNVEPQPTRKYSAPLKLQGRDPLIAGIALVLVVILVIGIVASSLGGPLVKIGSALQKTVEKGNMTVEFEIDVDGESMEGIAMVNIDMKKQDVTLYCEMEMDGMDFVYGIYDGYLVAQVESYYYGTYCTATDISDELDEMFDSYEENTDDFNMQDFLDELDDMMYGELSELFDFDELENCVNKYVKKLNSESWLKKNAGYKKTSKSGVTYYTFEPALYDFAMASLPFLEKAFEDPDDYEDMMDSMEDSEDYMEDYEVSISIGLKSGYLTKLEAEFDFEGDTMEIYGEITDIGKTEIDVDLLEDMLDEAQ